jgi:hypothetical protein
MIADGADPAAVAGLMIGAFMRFLRARGVPKEKYLKACEILWDNNNTPDAPLD